MDWDESVDKDKGFGPRQSERAEIYNPLIQQLLEEDKAYKCYMTEEELEAEREAQIVERCQDMVDNMRINRRTASTVRSGRA